MSPRILVAVVLVLLASGACTDNMPTAPTTPAMTVDGTWQADLSVAGQSARMSWVLTQKGTATSGPVTVSLSNGIVLMNGLLAGTVSNATTTSAALAYTIAVGAGGIPSQPSCTGQFGGTMTAAAGAPAKMTGDFSLKSGTCTPPVSNGNVTLTKQ
jgi:hypothetical protein